MEKEKTKVKARIAVFIIVAILIIVAAVFLFLLPGNKEEAPSLHEIPVRRIGQDAEIDLNMPYEYVRSMINRQEDFLANAEDIEAQTVLSKQRDDISLAYKKPWHIGPIDRLSYYQGITSIKTIERKDNCKVTFIKGYDSSYMMKKNEEEKKGYVILPAWMKENIAKGYTVDDIDIMLINLEPYHLSRNFKVIGFYQADTQDTIYVSMYTYGELFEYDEAKLNKMIKSLSIYYEEEADVSAIYGLMNEYFSDSATKKEGRNCVYTDYDFYYIPNAK